MSRRLFKRDAVGKMLKQGEMRLARMKCRLKN